MLILMSACLLFLLFFFLVDDLSMSENVWPDGLGGGLFFVLMGCGDGGDDFVDDDMR